MSVHDTQHYPEIKRLLGIPEDEPIFILRAQDMVALATIGDYTERSRTVGADSDFIRELVDVSLNFADWREANRDQVKVPD